MTNARPLLVALPLDHQTGDILAIAALLARRLEAPVVVVHAILRAAWRMMRASRLARPTRAASSSSTSRRSGPRASPCRRW